jgi:hypothetical protein
MSKEEGGRTEHQPQPQLSLLTFLVPPSSFLTSQTLRDFLDAIRADERAARSEE